MVFVEENLFHGKVISISMGVLYSISFRKLWFHKQIAWESEKFVIFDAIGNGLELDKSLVSFRSHWLIVWQ